MAKSRRRRLVLVVDASVARAASEPPSVESPGGPCREFLLEMLDSGCRVAMSREMFSEWKRNESEFARTWRAEMVGRKRVVVKRELRDEIGFDDAVEAAGFTKNQRAAVEKDRHLVLLAVATDRAVVSLDEVVRGLLRDRSEELQRLLDDLDWVNPAREEDMAVVWLREGAKAGERRLSRVRDDFRGPSV